jgi:hypothetical protein
MIDFKEAVGWICMALPHRSGRALIITNAGGNVRAGTGVDARGIFDIFLQVLGSVGGTVLPLHEL